MDYLNRNIAVTNGVPTGSPPVDLYPWMSVKSGATSYFSEVRMKGPIYDKFNVEILGGGGPSGTGQTVQYVYRPNEPSPQSPVYASFNDLMTAVTQNQANSVTTEIIIDDSIAPAVINGNYNMSLCILKSKDLNITSRTDLQLNGTLTNLLGASCITFKINDLTSPRLVWSQVKQQFYMQTVAFDIQGMTGPTEVLSLSNNCNLFLFMVDGTFLSQQSPNYSYFYLNGDTSMIAFVQSGTIIEDVFTSNSTINNQLQIYLIDTATQVNLPFNEGPPNLTVFVDLTSIAQLVSYNDGHAPTLVPNPYYANRPSVDEAITSLKKGIETVYYRPNAPSNVNSYPYFSTWDEIIIIVGSTDNLYEIVFDDTYQNPIVLTNVVLNCQGRVSFTGRKQNSKKTNRVLVQISNDGTYPSGISDAIRFSYIDFEMTQSGVTGNTIYWNTNISCTFEYCSLAVEAGTVRPVLYSNDQQYVLTFKHCDLNTPVVSYLMGVFASGTIELEIYSSTVNNNVIDPSSQITIKIDSTSLYNPAFLSGCTTVLLDKSEYVKYATAYSKVPSPAIANNVSIKEVIDSIAIFKAAAGVQSGFVQNSSANTVYDESTFTGDTGTSAFTIGEIVKALKEAGILQT